MIRIILFCLVSISAFTGPWLVFLLAAIAYGVYYTGIELIILAVLVDAFFMSASAFTPYYTLAAVLTLCLAEFVKPYTVFYNQEQ